MSSGPHLYVDADACPVKAEAVKVAERHGLAVAFVANAWMTVPRAPRVRLQVVSGSFDAAVRGFEALRARSLRAADQRNAATMFGREANATGRM